jgi:hypothetical protein
MVKAGLFHGEIIPRNFYVGIEMLNFHLHNFNLLEIGENYLSQYCLSPIYEWEVPRTISKDKEIKAAMMNIVQFKLPEGVDLLLSYAHNQSHRNSLLKIFKDHPVSFDSYDQYFLLEIANPDREESIKLKCLRIMALRASSYIEKHLKIFKFLGAMKDWRWKTKEYPAMYGQLFLIDKQEEFLEKMNARWASSPQRVERNVWSADG